MAQLNYLKTEFMKDKVIFLILTIFLTINNIISQTYYGKNKIGKMVLIDDSICIMSFVNYAPNKPIIDTCFYKKYDNKIVINSKYKHKFYITPIDTPIKIYNSVPVIFKSYFINSKDAHINHEFIVDVDTTKFQFIIQNDSRYLHVNTFFIISYKNNYYKMYFYHFPSYNEKYYLVKYNQSTIDYSLYFDSITFIIKGNKLIPEYILYKNELKNDNTFYLENGFNIPVMKISKKQKSYKGYSKDVLKMSGIPETLCKTSKIKYYKFNIKKPNGPPIIIN